MLMHGNLVKAAAISAAGFEQTDKDIVTLFALPMHHAVGLVVIMLTSLYAGSTVIMLSGLSIHGLLETIEREKATIFMGVPFVHALLLREVAAGGIRHDIGSLRLCASAGAPLPLEIIERYRELMGRELIQFYGLTEATCHVTCQQVDGGSKDGYVGRALPGFQIKVVDDAGGELGPNQAGEIIIKGPIMSGYYNNPQATGEAIKDGWLYTGDVGSMDEEGDIVILGLKKPMLIVKGQNIYHSDVEDILATHLKVAEVAAVGIADPEGMRGEVVRAVIRLKPGQTAREPEIKRYCLARLANYKVPKQVIFVASLPRIPGGQVDKEALKALLPGASAGGRVSTKIN
jgi:long-chain acyl-CoA synthetase